MKRHFFMIVILLVSLTMVPGGVYAQRPDVLQSAGAPSSLEFEQIAAGLASPVGIEHAGDGSDRLFIILRGGQVVIYDGSQVLPTPFLDVSSLVITGGSEQGLLGIAFHPDYENNGYFYVDYTRKSDGATVIARYHVSADPNVADDASAFSLLTIPQPFSNHNGGQLKFGPDGFLYIGMGDGGSGGDPNNLAQSPTSLLGKILRIDVNNGSPYGIPADNPFVSNPNVDDRIWALGLRNPWRFTFDRLTGDLFIADVGQDNWEEVNYQPASSAGGENYGWSCYEGLHDYRTDRNCTFYGVLTDPVLEYPHGVNDSNGCSITGGYIYRGNRYPALKGVYLYGDFCTGNIWAATTSGSSWISNIVADTNFLIPTFGEDESGELYVASLGSGAIYHIAASSFADVPTSYWSWNYIEKLYSSSITVGCTTNPLNYCPEATVTRAQMAVFLLRGIHGSSYTPPPLGVTSGFNDVPTNYWAVAWIKQLAADGITSGCGGGNYCPEAPVTRAQMAVFLLRAEHGALYNPPSVGVTSGFNDVPTNYWAAGWIKQLAAEGITSGCGDSNYCPESPVTRAQMAVFLVKTFSLP
jgi:glucose/arabinose dehydrogenase